jgi:hypothetical protein
MKRFLYLLTVFVAALAATPAHAQFVHNGNLEANRLHYQQFAVQNGGHSIGLAYNFPSGTPFVASGGLLGNFWDEQDQRFYTWGASVAHNFRQGSQFSTNHRVLTGTNFLTNPGEEYTVAEYFLHPGYTNIGNNSPDVALFRLDVALLISNVTVAPVNIGDRITYAGFGRPGTPATGLLTHDGFGRAFDGYVDAFGDAGTADFYAASIFWMSGDPKFLALGGLGTSGASGSFGYNQLGQLTTIAALATAGTPSYYDATYGVHLSDPLIANWWNATLPPAVPAPGALALLGVGALMAGLRRRAS